MKEFLISLLNVSLTMSMVIVGVLLLRNMLDSRLAASFRCYMWLMVLLGLLIPYRPSIPLPIEPLRIPAQAELSGVVVDESGAAVGIETHGNIKYETAQNSASNGDKTSAFSFAFILFGLWITAAMGIMIFHLQAYGRFLLAVRRWGVMVKDERVLSIWRDNASGSRNITLKTFAPISSPMLIGFLNPTILLPRTDMGADELVCVFRHEMAHYKRGDLWMNLLILIVSAVHWFNPFVHLMVRTIRADCEAACDGIAVAKEGSDGRRRYGETIIGFVGKKNTGSPVLSTYFYGGSKGMKTRLVSIMDTGKKSKWLAGGCIALVFLLTALSGTAYAATTGSEDYMGEAAAKSLALAHAGVQENRANFLKVFLDDDDGRIVYDVEFYSGSIEYDYEVDAVSGDIVEFDKEIEYYSIPEKPSGSEARVTDNTGGYIGDAAAKSAALTHAGVTEAQTSYVNAHLDHDDGRMDYDVQFHMENTEYEYEIDAVTGSVLEYSRETRSIASVGGVDTHSQTVAASEENYIGEARAKAIALENAGLSESKVSRLKTELDFDNRRATYEVDFNNDRMEYEYEIDAVTGAILSSDAEYDD